MKDMSLENLIMTDAELTQLSSSNTEYFGILVQRYQEKIKRYISRITYVPREDQEDMLQNIFIKAYLNINSFKPSLSFNAWIYRIAHNEIIDHNRKQKTKTKYGNYDHDDEIFEWTSDTHHFLLDLDIKETEQEVHQIINRLDIKYREVIYLFYIEEYSYREISDILKKPEGTIGTLINRAKKQYKELYEQII